ncbi:MAG: zf-HC2 domain-containing protein [Clostridia bacterium]|nr:zf-HC2 domain-containing protein [Clostridia bacterium]
MKCENFDEYVNLYLDGLISEKQTEELNKHIKICEKCREEFTVIKNAKKVIDSEEEKELPANFHKELMTKIAEIKKSDKKIVKFPVFKVAAVAAAFAITVFACYNFTTEDFNKGVDVSGLETKNIVSEPEKTEKSVPVANDKAEPEKEEVKAETKNTSSKEKNEIKITKENNTKDEINYKTEEKIPVIPKKQEVQPEVSTPVSVVKQPEPTPEIQNEMVEETEPVVEDTALDTTPTATTEEPVAPADYTAEIQPAYTEPEITEPEKVEPAEKRISSGGSAGGGGGGSASATFSASNAVAEVSQTVTANEVLSSLGFGEANGANTYVFDFSRYGEVMNALAEAGATDYSVTTDDVTKTFTVVCN